MNHFAHLALSQNTVESVVGNLLGDFARGLDQSALSVPVMAGLNNHRAVDKFTDNHPLVIELKAGFSSQRRRFAGIALDIFFDHLLINHWKRFEPGTAEQAAQSYYLHLKSGQSLMPGEEMRRVTLNMIKYDWFGHYQNLESIAQSLDRVAARIRFTNNFHNAIEDIKRNHDRIEQAFLTFYPELKAHIRELSIESG